MHSRMTRFLLGSAATVFAAVLLVPMSVAQAAGGATDAMTPSATGDVGITKLIPGRCEYTGDQPTLSQGSTGIAVKQAQCEYNWSTTGTNIAIDGQFGPITRDAIMRFQRCVGIAVDGVVGPVTWSHLNYWAASSGYPPGC
jgi:peptidoglycan hydrolase-like protein with peptidoglycan-binding domain